MFESVESMGIWRDGKTRKWTCKESTHLVHFCIGGPSAKERRPDVVEQIQAGTLALSQMFCMISVHLPHPHLSPRITVAFAFPAISLSPSLRHQASILCGAIVSVLSTPKEGVKARLQVGAQHPIGVDTHGCNAMDDHLSSVHAQSGAVRRRLH